MFLGTLDGYDLQFGTNVLGHAHLTLSLLPELKAGALSSADGKSRVVNTSSLAAYAYRGQIHWETLEDGASRRDMNLGKYWLYGQSKLVSGILLGERCD